MPLLLATVLGVTGCGPAVRDRIPAGKDGPGPSAARPQSEFDYYCSLHPTSTTSESVAGPRPFAPAVYDEMKARGYKVYLVRYRYQRRDDGFGGFGGFGFRDFFGLDNTAPKVVTGQRAAVIWETRRGEYFLVDHYYASPMWLDGSNWLEKVRFYDPAATSVELIKS